MCAIIGIASKSYISARAWLKAGSDAMAHRGPDHSGEWWSKSGTVGMLHRRLSIIDISITGNQPMSYDGGMLKIVFNGEIYNHVELRKELFQRGYKFKSESDTEVLLAAFSEWGTDCLLRLNGMFAFAIFDIANQTLFLARDRAGEKPLFYHFENGTLRFASEIKGLLQDNTLSRRINPEALDCYLAMGYVPGDRCMLQGFKKLPPAHALLYEINSGDTKLWRYWTLPEEPNYELRNECDDQSALLEELETLLEDSVRRQLVADVPVGVLLSGGVDSSLVTAMAVRATNRLKTYTVGFPGQKKHDETHHARLIANHFGTNHTELMAEPVTADVLQKLAIQYDEPIVDSSMIPTYLVSQLVRRECTVALGGDGGDELFGGYHLYSRLLWMQRNLGRIPHFMRKVISRIAGPLLPVGMRGRTTLQSLAANFKDGLPLIMNHFDSHTRMRLMKGKDNWNTIAEAIYDGRVPPSDDLLQRATRMDFANYLAEDILVKVDRASMLNSLEVRAPLLDYRIIEFAFGKVPSNLKATQHNKKILLKRLAAKMLPPKFEMNRKQGFSIPLSSWLKNGPIRELFHEVLCSSECLFDKKTIARLWSGQGRGRNNGERLFALVLFELWRREYKVTL